jgi:hypothetical protein
MTVIRAGDVYCPRCWKEDTAGVDFTLEDAFWCCENCKFQWTWDHTGTDWEWPPGQKPNPGCPWCGTAHIIASVQRYGRDGEADGKRAHWRCMRELCARRWFGFWTRHTAPDGTHTDRWTLRVPASQVPFTWIDPVNPRNNVRWGPAASPDSSYTG